MNLAGNLKVKIGKEPPFFQYLASGSGMLAIVSSGLHYGWPSPSLPKLLEKDSLIPITESEGFWLATMPLFGAILGSITAPPLVDNIGRRKTVLLTSVPYLISWIMIIFSWNVELLYIARFISGISDGWGFSSVPMYIGEISQPKIRGLLASGVSVTFILGILVINILGSYLSIQMTAIIACVIPVILLISFFWMPESPYYLIMKNRQEDAKRSLAIFIGSKAADAEFLRIDQAVKEDLPKSRRSNPLDLFTVQRNRRAVMVMILVRGTQQMSGYSATVFYTQNIFKEAGSNLSEEIASILYFSIQLLVTVIAAGLVDKLGRRPLLLISTAGAFVTLLVEGVYFYIYSLNSIDVSNFSIIPVIALILYIIFFSIGLQNIPILMLSEMFNQDIKAVALCFADLYFAALATGTSKYFQVTRDAFGMHVPFISFSIFCGVAIILIYVIVPETTNKTLEEIQDYFKGSTKETKKEGTEMNNL